MPLEHPESWDGRRLYIFDRPGRFVVHMGSPDLTYTNGVIGDDGCGGRVCMCMCAYIT